MKLQTTDTELHALEQIIDTTRESSETVKVSKVALRNLLRDHYELNSAVLRKTGELPETVA